MNKKREAKLITTGKKVQRGRKYKIRVKGKYMNEHIKSYSYLNVLTAVIRK